MDLEDLIIRKIKASGPILFRDYMDLALYHPALGYYTSADYRIGKKRGLFYQPIYFQGLWRYGRQTNRRDVVANSRKFYGR